jgi:hypothetical protein
MYETSNEERFNELKAELQVLRAQLELLNVRASAAPSARQRVLSKIRGLRWPMAAGFLVLAGAMAQDPSIRVQKDGGVYISKNLGVGGSISVPQMTVYSEGLAVRGGGIVVTDNPQNVGAGTQYKTSLSIGPDGAITGKSLTARDNGDITGGKITGKSLSLGGDLTVSGGTTNIKGPTILTGDLTVNGAIVAPSIEATFSQEYQVKVFNATPKDGAEYWAMPIARTAGTACFLVGIRGAFLGSGEGAEVREYAGNWEIRAREAYGNFPLIARARCIGTKSSFLLPTPYVKRKDDNSDLKP